MSEQAAQANTVNKKASIFKILPPRPAKTNFYITDFFTNIDEVTKPTFLERNTARSKIISFLTGFHVLNPTTCLALIILGLLTSLFAFGIEYATLKLFEFREFCSETGIMSLDLFIWVIFSLFFGFCAASVGKYISQDAEGIGIPEIKSILSGVRINRFLSYRIFYAKVLGFISACAAGLSIGSEGPYVHISGIIANKLTKIKIFRHLRVNLTLRNQILGAAVAAGIAAKFGSPIGGMLFSIEVTATYYIVNNMWRGIFCAIWCVIGFWIVRSGNATEFFELTSLPSIELTYEIFFFMILGVISGLLGSFIVFATNKLTFYRTRAYFPAIHSRYVYTLIIVLIISIITFYIPFMHVTEKTVLNTMFKSGYIPTNTEADWHLFGLGLDMLLYIVIKTIISILSFTCPVPFGVFSPVFTIGSVLGRLTGYVIDNSVGTIYTGVYAVVGAASVTASVTHSLSVAIIVFEITGQISFLLPMMVSVLISFAISNWLGMSIYDAILELKGLPYLPGIKPSNLYSYAAKDAIGSDFTYVKNDATIRDFINAVEEAGVSLNKIPIVDDKMTLIKELSVSGIREYLKKYYSEYPEYLPPFSRDRLDAFFKYLLENPDDMSVVVPVDNPGWRDEEEEPEIKAFLDAPVNFDSDSLQIDEAPLAIPETTPLAKVHFLFIMLGLMQIYVTKRGVLIGVISRDNFTMNK
ncbi:unnamed protein product [Blepharisma stoltei]|uniref:Chloride channel protein n=1 Tax=Blepharisma stoltei TaxID=1481888 RepID=A0AAU9KCN9_9CILI|nr:unnamed protein product [Blepharisma stoltei]